MLVGLWQNRLALLAIFASVIVQCAVPVSAAVPSLQYFRNNNGEVKRPSVLSCLRPRS
ncbi:uncharacterized protein LAESUDRAFT_725205 [Laetiporus sulphureus 93-53]|uniref:Uncharacterized protein n=1 Tax=Laetiporus sulphureus 93-53 TaxID=1314785 RepID=A0A165ELB9_9APHY|nr:uncharacterized protein LAESUDRAFT_725205 [Laetiporus sulphureus 93-53]KZT07297.1 hypothetical protein LAESUDRAFT_725205 [Laetiporus sulphureus 93-53]